MNYAQIRKFDVANGIGIRSTLFVSGCEHRCNGCFNQDYWDYRYGETWSKEAFDKLVGYVGLPQVKGISLLGGEPFAPSNAIELARLAEHIKEMYPSKDIWVWSGYTFEQLIKNPVQLELLQYCDTLVDGKFIAELKDLKLRFRGSSNQRIIDVLASLKEGKVILSEYH